MIRRKKKYWVHRERQEIIGSGGKLWGKKGE